MHERSYPQNFFGKGEEGEGNKGGMSSQVGHCVQAQGLGRLRHS
jgi:hypothetical protein